MAKSSNVDNIATTFVSGVILVAVLTTVLGRGNTPRVFDSVGRAGSNLISAALGRGVNIS